MRESRALFPAKEAPKRAGAAVCALLAIRIYVATPIRGTIIGRMAAAVAAY